jgi:hypothetical protein
MNYGGIGGGLDDANAYNCLIVSNLARLGGGIDMSGEMDGSVIGDYEVYNSVVTGNTAEEYGGGIFGGEAHNCLISGNTAMFDSGGGIHKTTAFNCTIVDNASHSGVGGVDQSCIYNSIVISNVSWGLYPEISQDSLVFHSCAPGLADGMNGNLSADPLFVDLYNGDYRLLATSPCIDTGSNSVVASSMDLIGNERIVDGDLDGIPVVDMGAYEFPVMKIGADCIAKPMINLNGKGRIPVKILSTAEFDAMQIDPSTVRLAGVSPVRSVLGDVDGDGDVDLKLFFNAEDLVVDPHIGETMLICQTYDGLLMFDTCKVVPQ